MLRNMVPREPGLFNVARTYGYVILQVKDEHAYWAQQKGGTFETGESIAHCYLWPNNPQARGSKTRERTRPYRNKMPNKSWPPPSPPG